MPVHAEFGVECFQVFLVQLKHILNVQYLHNHKVNKSENVDRRKCSFGVYCNLSDNCTRAV